MPIGRRTSDDRGQMTDVEFDDDQLARKSETKVDSFSVIRPPSSDIRYTSFAGLVVLAGSPYPIPSRTRPLNFPAPMVLSLKTWKSRSLPGLPRTLNLFTMKLFQPAAAHPAAVSLFHHAQARATCPLPIPDDIPTDVRAMRALADTRVAPRVARSMLPMGQR